jgi:hypothetical protein
MRPAAEILHSEVDTGWSGEPISALEGARVIKQKQYARNFSGNPSRRPLPVC